MVAGSPVRFHVRVLSLGFWSLLFGGVLLYATSRALSVVASASTAAPAGVNPASEPWLSAVARDGLVGAYQFGAASVAVGVAFAVLGGWLLRATVPGRRP